MNSRLLVSSLTLAGAQLAALLAPFLPAALAHADAGLMADKTARTASANASSLQSIESTWLKIPTACKARGFNASPVEVPAESGLAEVMQIYQALKA